MKDTDEAATAVSSKEQPPSGHHLNAEDDHLSYSSQDSENSGIVLVLNKEKICVHYSGYILNCHRHVFFIFYFIFFYCYIIVC